MIGIFDSGIGGMALLKKAKQVIGDKACIYLADTANFPYGTKSQKEIIDLSRKNLDILKKYGAKVFLIACNTATISAINVLRQEGYGPLIGIEPGLKVAASGLIEKTIMLATTQTSQNHSLLKEKTFLGVEIYPNDELVAAIERTGGRIDDNQVRKYIGDRFDEKSQVVLGCTHYHLIKDQLARIYPGITFIAPEEAVIRRLEEFAHLAENGEDIFLTTGDPVDLETKIGGILGKKVNVRKVL